MTSQLTWGNDRLALTFQWDADSPVTLAHLASDEVDLRFDRQLPVVEILTAGNGHWIANDRLVHTTIGRELRYQDHHARATATGDQLVINLAERNGLHVAVTYDLPNGVGMFRVRATVTNHGDSAIFLESVTSWTSTLGAPSYGRADVEAWRLLEADFDWLGEGRWTSASLRSLLPALNHQLTTSDPRGEHSAVSTGTWSTGKHSPLAILVADDLPADWVFQVEHNGAWRWEVGEHAKDGYVALSGPTNLDHSWSKKLMPGETFTTVPASAACTSSFDSAVRTLTAYRRAMRQQHHDNGEPSVIFNDYMNTIQGDPTTERLLPLIAAAAEVGADVFCIDCGWYDDTGNWWPSVGEWLPSQNRFPNGIGEVIDAIRSAGMIPGIWIEPEVIGVTSPIASKLPPSAYFQRHGQRIVEHDRYTLDLRDPAARAHLDSVIARLVEDYGIGYVKFDYNVSPGAGTDHAADSPGDGLLAHNRAYSDWIDSLHGRYPDLILENCSSGGMREDFAQTSRFQVQSTSDQQDFRLYPAIAVSAPLMMLPEQAGNWAYPQPTMSTEDIVFNLNTTMLGRFFLSGYLNKMTANQRRLIAEAISTHKRWVRPLLPGSVPFWPLGLPSWADPVLALGLRGADRSLVTVWVRDLAESAAIERGGAVELPVPHHRGQAARVVQIFPTQPSHPVWRASWDAGRGIATVTVPTDTVAARTFAVLPEGR